MDERLKPMLDALKDETERIVFRGKLDRLNEADIARRVEAEAGGRMTVYMVRETWRVIRARFLRMFPEAPDSWSD